MTKDELVAFAKAAGGKRGLDPALVCAVIEQESAWQTEAIRYEDAFYDRYVIPLGIGSATESRARAFSWGLMQVMGQVAREIGFKGKYLSELCVPQVGIEIGCEVLKAKMARAQWDTVQGLLYYNGGGNKHYPAEVLARMSKYK
jgi:soluble lytic murein transglycosylase-like protein